MKRDMDLIRLQLLRVEGEPPVAELDNHSEEQRIYHMALCIEAGLVDGVIRKNEVGYPNGTVATRLTWKGHEFLDAARNDTIWRKALERIKKARVQVPLAVLEEVLRKAAKDPGPNTLPPCPLPCGPADGHQRAWEGGNWLLGARDQGWRSRSG